MYEPSSHFYTNVVQNKVRHVEWRGVITADGVDYDFGANHIVANSGKITNEVCGSKVEIGTVYSSELDIQLFIDDIGVPRDKIYGAKIVLRCELAANGAHGTCPMGVFNVVEATQKGEICSIVAYDNMIFFDEVFPVTAGRNMPYTWLEQLCEPFGVTIGQTETEVRLLPNGSYALTMDWTDDQSTYRDVLAELAAAVGCVAHMNRDGELELLNLTYKLPVATLRANDRFDSDIAHMQWSPGCYYVRNSATGGVYNAGEDPLAFDLGENAFLQNPGYVYNPAADPPGKEFPITTMLQNLLTRSQALTVVPIDADIPLDPCLDLFDIVNLTGGQANNTKALITSITHTIGGGTKINCAGANTTEESSPVTHSGGGRESEVWVDGLFNEEIIQIPTGTQYWEDQLSKKWGSLKNSTWDEILNGGGWVEVDITEDESGFVRGFSGEFTLGVIGLTVEYQCENDTEVRFKVQVNEWMGGTSWVHKVTFETVEQAKQGTHTTTLTVPFGILDKFRDSFQFRAFVSGIDL